MRTLSAIPGAKQGTSTMEITPMDEHSIANSTTEDLHDRKRRKYQEKQQRLQEARRIQEQRREWIEKHAHFVTLLDDEPFLTVKLDMVRRPAGGHQEIHYNGELSSNGIEDKDMQRIQSLWSMLLPYVDLKEGGGKETRSVEQSKRTFVAEGTEVVRLLIQKAKEQMKQDTLQEQWTVSPSLISILVKPSTFFEEPIKLMTDVEEALVEYSNKTSSTGMFHVFIASEPIMSKIANFPIARGAMACGNVTQRDEAWLKEFLKSRFPTDSNNPIRALALDRISDTSNLGSVIRTSAAFDVDVIILSEDSCDAWYRRSVRVSMGHVFSLPVARVGNLPSFLRYMETVHGIESYAAVVDRKKAKLQLEDIACGGIPSRWCLVVGNEASGICDDVINACSTTITIGIAVGVDSLSLPLATGILLHGMKEREQRV